MQYYMSETCEQRIHSAFDILDILISFVIYWDRLINFQLLYFTVEFAGQLKLHPLYSSICRVIGVGSNSPNVLSFTSRRLATRKICVKLLTSWTWIRICKCQDSAISEVCGFLLILVIKVSLDVYNPLTVGGMISFPCISVYARR